MKFLNFWISNLCYLKIYPCDWGKFSEAWGNFSVPVYLTKFYHLATAFKPRVCHFHLPCLKLLIYSYYYLYDRQPYILLSTLQLTTKIFVLHACVVFTLLQVTHHTQMCCGTSFSNLLTLVWSTNLVLYIIAQS